MAWRVGMSTNPRERIDYWKNLEGHSYSRDQLTRWLICARLL